MSLEGGTYGGFPIKFLVLVVSTFLRMYVIFYFMPEHHILGLMAAAS